MVRSRDSSSSPCRTRSRLALGQEEVALGLRLMVEKIKLESFLEAGNSSVRVYWCLEACSDVVSHALLMPFILAPSRPGGGKR